MDLFSTNRGENFLIPHLQSVLNENTSEFINSVWALSQNTSFYMQYNSELALLNTTFSSDMFNNSYLYSTAHTIAQEMAMLTKPKTDVIEMVAVLPDHEVAFELFDVISLNVDNSLYAHLHLPEVKLYYPEPFIASPSFVHEELWFIHILHYQH